MKRSQKMLGVVVVLFGLVVSACAADVPAPDSGGNSNANARGEASGGESSGEGGRAELGQLGVSLGRTELQASNSSTVSLEGGNKPQLVEFFAYW